MKGSFPQGHTSKHEVLHPHTSPSVCPSPQQVTLMSLHGRRNTTLLYSQSAPFSVKMTFTLPSTRQKWSDSAAQNSVSFPCQTDPELDNMLSHLKQETKATLSADWQSPAATCQDISKGKTQDCMQRANLSPNMACCKPVPIRFSLLFFDLLDWDQWRGRRRNFLTWYWMRNIQSNANPGALWAVNQRKAGGDCVHPVGDGCLWWSRQRSKRCWSRGQTQETQDKLAAYMQSEHQDLTADNTNLDNALNNML